ADMRHRVIDDLVDQHIPQNAYADQWDVDGLSEKVPELLGEDFPVREWADEEGVDDEAIRERLKDETDRIFAEKEQKIGADDLRMIEKEQLLRVLDHHWREHLVMLEHLRSVIGLRGYAQRDPLNEYKSEAFQLFDGLLNQLRVDVTKLLGQMRPMTPEEQEAYQRQMTEMQERVRQQMEMQAAIDAQAQAVGAAALSGPAEVEAAPARKTVSVGVALAEIDPDDPSTWGKVGRNAPCPCGSGKKYKHCHGRIE
ncbi:MAG: SEC-C metal-binding domain-containing protein, partial [Pseudomonadota bacterium]